MSKEGVQHFFRGSLSNLEKYSKIMAALDAWEAQCLMVDNRHGVGDLTKIEDDAWKERNALTDLICKTPAQSVVGVFVKLKVWDEIHHGYPVGHKLYCEIFGSAFQDAKRISGQTGGRHV